MQSGWGAKLKGVFFLTMVILIWVGSAVLIQAIFNSADTQFNKPLFLTYYSTSFFTLYLIPLGCEYLFLLHRSSKEQQSMLQTDQTDVIEQV
jgi:hypothetical protein